MPGTANLILQPLDALGTSNKKYGEGVLTLQPLDADGAVYEHSNGALVLPMITMNVTVSSGGTFYLDRSLPQLTAEGYFGGQAEITLPMLTFAGTATFPVMWGADFTLPMLIVDSAGYAWGQGYADITLPRLLASVTFGGDGAAVLPQLVVAGSVSTMERSTGAILLPLPRVTGTFSSIVGEAWQGDIRLPALVAGPYGIARLSLPMLRVLGMQSLGGASGVAGAGADFEGWLLNTRNGAITRITNFPFTQFTSVNNKTFAVGPGGLYLLGGETDNGTLINWKFETGLDDLGKPGTKHVPYLYLDGIIDGVIQIALIDDRSRVFAYEYSTKQRGAIHLPHRRKLGNGIRTRSMAFRISSDTGAYIELDSLEPQITVTQRSIG